ncbi:MAG: phosphoribosylamine--glycine ligase [Rickettsiales bacterium]|nr:phosphoribosylamine--glycine ligase [Rickettsiales bacterium]
MANVLVIGSGGREHALCWRLKQSSSVSKVFCAPGNGGIAQEFTCVNLSKPDDIIAFCRTEAIALVVIGPEQPLVEGLADQLEAAQITVFGPSALAARLEGSKDFTKAICKKYGIPTAAYESFTEAAAAKAYLAGKSYPIVMKADGLAAGKGVIIAENETQALAAVDELLPMNGTLVIEEFLVGEEVSFFALSDGKTTIEFGYAQDHKRAFDGDTGPNTGGMGTYSPAPIFTDGLRDITMRDIIAPTVIAMQKEGCPFKGVLFAGLMITQDGPKLLEYNTRFGDPETQVLMARFSGDLYQLLLSCARGQVESKHVAFSNDAAVCVVMATQGYPGAYPKGSIIRKLDAAGAVSGVKIFHAGTQAQGAELVASGGRVLGVTALAGSIAEAKSVAYQSVDKIDWPEGFCRRDIAWRASKS